MDKPTCDNATFCFLDFDWDHNRSKLARAAAFVAATDTRYGFSDKDLLRLGGAEIAHRVQECYDMDHEWGGDGQSIQTRPPMAGNRIVVKLFWDEAPLACENFATLCANGSYGRPAPMGQSGKPLTYRGSNVHRIVPGFVIQGGDFVKGNGSGGESIYNGKKFKDENKLAHHDKRGILSMGNAGKNANSSQFFVTFQACPQCDGKHTIFGEVVSGFPVLDALEELGTEGGTPAVPVTITECGIFHPTISPGAGFWLDKPDPDAYSGVNPVFIVRPRVAVVGPSDAVVQKFETVLQGCVVVGVISSTSTEREAEGDTLSLQQRVVNLLNAFAVDAVVVAPACSQEIIEPLDSLASAWTEKSVVVYSKPVQALDAVRNQTWLTGQSTWNFEWA
jgi:cyclophilin family peptidyl-prolyl cis-trans isomerase